MSLDYKLTKIKDWEELVASEEEWNAMNNGFTNPWTQTLIFGCMPVGLGSITEKNIAEWYARYTLWCDIHDFDHPPFEQVVRHIGLSTNVANETQAQWFKRIIKWELTDRIKQAEHKLTLGESPLVTDE